MMKAQRPTPAVSKVIARKLSPSRSMRNMRLACDQDQQFIFHPGVTSGSRSLADPRTGMTDETFIQHRG
jgi:hypothetical protein